MPWSLVNLDPNGCLGHMRRSICLEHFIPALKALTILSSGSNLCPTAVPPWRHIPRVESWWSALALGCSFVTSRSSNLGLERAMSMQVLANSMLQLCTLHNPSWSGAIARFFFGCALPLLVISRHVLRRLGRRILQSQALRGRNRHPKSRRNCQTGMEVS